MFPDHEKQDETSLFAVSSVGYAIPHHPQGSEPSEVYFPALEGHEGDVDLVPGRDFDIGALLKTPANFEGKLDKRAQSRLKSPALSEPISSPIMSRSQNHASRRSPRKSPQKARKPVAPPTSAYQPPSPKKRNPQQCKKCPNRPFRASEDCVHSKAYRELRNSVENLGIVCPETASAADLRQLRDSRLHPSQPLTQNALSALVTPTTDVSNLGSSHVQDTPGLAMEQGSLSFLFPQPLEHSFQTPSRRQLHGEHSQFSSLQENTASPFGQFALSAPPGSPEQSTSGTPSRTGVSQTPASDQLATPSDTSTLFPAGTPSKPPKVARIRASRANPLFGTVRGAGRGNSEWDVVRPKPLPALIESAGDATRRYRTELPNIINRCERLSHQTGCWLYVAALHPGGHGSFQHFASRRLLDEPDQTLLDAVHNASSRMFNVLQRSRRSDLQTIAAEVFDARVAATQAQTERDAMEKELQASRALIERLQALPSAAPIE